jgi:hypothetical protein
MIFNGADIEQPQLDCGVDGHLVYVAESIFVGKR